MGYIARPLFVPYHLPSEAFFYPAPDHAVWRDSRRRRGYRRLRLKRHQIYLRALRSCRTPVNDEIRRRAAAGRSAAESAWLRHEEDWRWYGHREPGPRRYHLCDCMLEAVGESHWWPFPEDEWEDEPEVAIWHVTPNSVAAAYDHRARAIDRFEIEMSQAHYGTAYGWTDRSPTTAAETV